MIQNIVKENVAKIGLGTYLGSFSDDDSKLYTEAIIFAVKNGITRIDTAINYRGMRSEKDVGNAVNILISSGIIKREDIFIASKAGLLFGDVISGRNPMKYLHEILEPQGIQLSDFCEYEGLYQTLNPDFFEIALQISIQNLGIDTLDVHYIHIPEITRAELTEAEFYGRIAKLFAWYEDKVKDGKVRSYGLAFEMLALEAEKEKWYINIEKVDRIAQEISNGSSHFKYLQIPYNIQCPYAVNMKNQSYKGESLSLVEAAHRMGLKVIGSKPLCSGKGFARAGLKEMISFALRGVDAINIGSKNVEHIQEILDML
ncbi:MAG: aldo/keto reductase [Clostridiales bacterium]|nr:aldo/keto reductase [Clostridiales bacterium]